MGGNVRIAGVGMVKFCKPSASPYYDDMAAQAAKSALKDAGLAYGEIEQAYVGYAIGDTTSGQQCLYPIGLSGIPIINVNNACASGSTALFLARQAVESGAVDVALAVGFEQMTAGALSSSLCDRPAVNGMVNKLVERVQGWDPSAPQAAQYFGGAAREYMKRYGVDSSLFARISVKARKHAALNPLAVFRDALTLEQVLSSPTVFDPLTRFQCCPPTCGAAAVVVVSDRYAKKRGISNSVIIAGQSMTTDTNISFDNDSMINGVGFDMTRRAAELAYQQAGIAPEDVDVVELHDCFSINEVISYEALGLCNEGGAEKMILDNDNTFGGKVVVNPSGGLLSKGHPLGATGLAQCAELVWQLRGQAEQRQVEGARVALQHNIGMGGACVVSLLTL